MDLRHLKQSGADRSKIVKLETKPRGPFNRVDPFLEANSCNRQSLALDAVRYWGRRHDPFTGVFNRDIC